MLLYIVRHGETEENARGVLQGRTPGKLNSTGIEQARLTGEALRNKGITAIHTSNLDRALDSALIISDMIGAVLVPEKKSAGTESRNLGGPNLGEIFRSSSPQRIVAHGIQTGGRRIDYRNAGETKTGS